MAGLLCRGYGGDGCGAKGMLAYSKAVGMTDDESMLRVIRRFVTVTVAVAVAVS